MRKIKTVVKVVLVGYIVIATMLYFFQEKLIFLPTKLPHTYSYSFSQPFEELFLNADDGSVLNALHFKNDNPKGAIVYFHGNAGDLSRWGNVATFFVDKGFDVIIMDYRTYGKSSGKLSEEALYSDAQLFYDFALQHYGPDEIILYGRSLGTGIATKLASENVARQLILESPYYSLEDVAIDRFPFLPIKWLLKYRIKSYEFIQQVRCPIAIFHGTDDAVVPYESGKKLYEVLPIKQKQMITIAGGGHNNLVEFEAYLHGINQVLRLD